MRELLAGLVPGLPDDGRRRRSSAAPTASRCTPSRRCACSWPRAGSSRSDGVYVPHGDLTTLAVPETLTALIAVAPRRRSTRPTGASSTTPPCWARASRRRPSRPSPGCPETELEPRLRALVRRELLTRETDPRSPERGQYAFVQALIREVAYNTLSKKDRKKLHLAAARYFESLGSDELAGALASHYLAAHANAGEDAEADALAGQARIALKAAAARAAALGALRPGGRRSSSRR